MNALKQAYAWHRPLMFVAGLMALSAVVSLVGLVIDPRVVTGLDAWAKPLKFSISILLYCITWAWLISQLPRGKRIAHAAGTVIAITIAIEQVIIVGAAATGTTSHFNVSTPLATALWAVMAVSITVLYIASLVTSIALFFWRLPDRSFTAAVRLGAFIALLGLGLAYLMTSPTASQLSDFRGIAGAHTVGLDDGGAGLPVLGWSTVGGDLRIPHFIGMHALQVIPLFALGLAWVGRRLPRLRAERVRTRLVWIVSAAYLAVVALVTFQALSGESIVRPSAPTVLAGAVITASALVAAVTVVFATRPAPPTRSAQLAEASRSVRERNATSSKRLGSQHEGDRVLPHR